MLCGCWVIEPLLWLFVAQAHGGASATNEVSETKRDMRANFQKVGTPKS